MTSQGRHNENGGCEHGERRGRDKTRHNENDVTMTVAGVWRYRDWQHVATGCTALVKIENR